MENTTQKKTRAATRIQKKHDAIQPTKEELLMNDYTTDRIVGHIIETEDYGRFRFMNANRKLRKIEDLKSEIQKYGLQYPVKVNQKYEVIDGQHRLEACKELGIPVRYFVEEDAGIKEVISINTSAKGWEADDYIQSYAAQGIKPYILMKEIRETYPQITPTFMLDIAFNNISGRNNSRKTNSSAQHALRSGKFEFYNYDHFVEYLLFYLELIDNGPKNNLSLFTSLFRLWSLEEFDSERLLKKKVVLKHDIPSGSGRREVLLILLETYNSGLRKNKLAFKFDRNQRIVLEGTLKKVEDQRKQRGGGN